MDVAAHVEKVRMSEFENVIRLTPTVSEVQQKYDHVTMLNVSNLVLTFQVFDIFYHEI